MIVAFGHKKQQGKDTAVGILYKHIRDAYRYGGVPDSNSYKCSFAEPLYHICNVLIPEFHRKGVYDDHPEDKESIIDRIGKTPRQVLIAIGQNLKTILGSDCFVVALLKGINSGHKHDVYLISDLRFPVEAAAVQAAGGVCVKVTRPGTSYPDDEVDSALDGWDGWDYELVNNGTIADFEVAVIALYDRIRKEHSK